MEHGGNLQQAVARFGEHPDGWLDLSTGINPTPYPLPSESISAAALWHRLPEEESLEGAPEGSLTATAAAYYQAITAPLPLPGSQAAISLLPALRPPSRVAIPEAEYGEHSAAWQRWGHAVQRINPALIEEGPPQRPDFDVVVLSNPNNPTGRRYPVELLQRWQQALLRQAGWLIVDEAFADADPAASLARCAGHPDSPNLIVLRSLGKFFGLAGARIGFLLGSTTIRERLSTLLGPWPLTGPSRQAACLALADGAWQLAQRTHLEAAAERLATLLDNAGLPVAGRTALYCWVPIAAPRAYQHALARAGIWVRAFDEPAGLRFGLPSEEDEWQRLAAAVAKA
ncbi:threonine-phosphate decarboxylase [Halorhodospira abdelmalekii]|uniref:threonine-phosphate decarboxylase CobD n=1 Tax=Halorhodospira abdelmalekii TaxID=421629 RepID=UPI0019032718|nr:threonine-phosphate decarboxylase CobD [Halorhodospira abdelmalekii]MBK1734742.1 threonine-phosphate decarboxylase [Halorhodospira abdelmalekii]